MKLAPWNPVRIAANPAAFICTHCGAVDGTKAALTVQGFMRKLRAFERDHNACAPAARLASAAGIASKVIAKASS
jgi:hypothetical protein